MGKEPLIAKIVLFIVKLLGRFENYLMKRLSLYWYAIVTSFIFMALPVIIVWTIFVIALYSPNPFRYMLIWSLILTLTLLCAAIDYIKTH